MAQATPTRYERRVVAILAADAASCSRLLHTNEITYAILAGAYSIQQRYQRNVIQSRFHCHLGTLLDSHRL